jgi:hypothetical protein
LSGKEHPHKINERLVIAYFRRVTSKDIDGLVSLFSDDAVIFQPFSKSTIVGKSQIEMFLKTVIMANSDMQRELNIETARDENSRLIVFVDFLKSSILKGKFTFEVDDSKKSKLEGRIKSLKIEFVD